MNMAKSLINTLFFAILLLSLSACKPKKQAYSFFVAGHVYGQPARKMPGLHPPFVRDFDYIRQYPNIRRGVFTGDIVYYSRPAFWDSVDTQIKQLGLPVHFAVGNHDEGHKSPYKDRYGITYYHFEEEGDLFLILNPGLGGWNIWKEQMSYLKKTLKKAHRYNNIFVFFHQVLWWEPDNEYRHIRFNSTDGRAPKINFWPEVIPLFKATGRPIYFFAGDVAASPQKTAFSQQQHDEQIQFIASGMGTGVEDNYVLVRVDKEKKVYLEVRYFNKDKKQRL